MTALVAAAVLAIAIFGKFAGAYVGAKASRMSGWEALTVGAAMNARGALEIIVATIGLSVGILTMPMYTIILMISVVTALTAPPLARWALRHVEFSEEEEERIAAMERREQSFVANLKRVLLPALGGRRTQVAAELLIQLVADEEVTVTRMHLGDGDGRADLERIDEREQLVENIADLGHAMGATVHTEVLVADGP